MVVATAGPIRFGHKEVCGDLVLGGGPPLSRGSEQAKALPVSDTRGISNTGFRAFLPKENTRVRGALDIDR